MSSVGLSRHHTFPVEAESVPSIGLWRHHTFPVETESVSSVGVSRHHTYPVEAESVSRVCGVGLPFGEYSFSFLYYLSRYHFWFVVILGFFI